MKIQVMGASLEIRQGDITATEAEAIVNPANTLLWLGGGISAAIKARGGETIEEEAVRQGPIEIGQAVLTSAGKLQAKHVIHAVIAGQDLKASEESVRTAMRNSLTLAAQRRINSIAVPSLVSEKSSMSAHACARAMIEETIAFLENSQAIRHVFFVLSDHDTYDIFKRQLETMFSR